MKKIFYTLISLIFLLSINACKGYKPIFSSSNIDFKIVDYSISGDKRLGNQIYSRLYNFSKSTENVTGAKNIYILINVSQNKNATAKNNAGKILNEFDLITINTDNNSKLLKIIVKTHEFIGNEDWMFLYLAMIEINNKNIKLAKEYLIYAESITSNPKIIKKINELNRAFNND